MGMDENAPVYDDEYEAEWASVIDDARADPADGLDDLLSIIDRMRADRGLGTDDLAPELGRRLDYAREIVDRLERGDDIEDGDVRAALAAVEAVFDDSRPFGDGRTTEAIDPAAADQIDLESAAGDIGETQTDP
jgi:ribosome-binding protein aMBF1 (putative translation factor)